ncbi:hypothetical protein KBB08_02330 [Candidatus Gracilibacteria bacterium]|nr:hypothetical protein [Candidatus Gracilibacteria bacterium]
MSLLACQVVPLVATPSLELTIPTMSQGQVTGHHTNTYCEWEDESYLLERKELDLSGQELWHVQRTLAVFNATDVLPTASTIRYRDGTMVTSERTYTEQLETATEALLIDGVLQMRKVYSYNANHELIGLEQFVYTISGEFSRHERYALVSKGEKNYLKREELSSDGALVKDYPMVMANSLIPSGVMIDV